MERMYVAIDLKSFYASVECVERHYDPLATNLVVADESRTEKTICLAVSPALKAYGIPGRARLFEVVERMKEVNAKRLRDGIRTGWIRRNENGQYAFSGSSIDATALAAHPDWEVAYCAAPPRMKLYEEYSTRIYSIYMKFVSSEDIHVYSCMPPRESPPRRASAPTCTWPRSPWTSWPSTCRLTGTASGLLNWMR